MTSFQIGLIVFACVFGGALAGMRPATRRGAGAFAAAGSVTAGAAGFRPRPIFLASSERCAA